MWWPRQEKLCEERGQEREEAEMGQEYMEGGSPGVTEANEDPVGTSWNHLDERTQL